MVVADPEIDINPGAVLIIDGVVAGGGIDGDIVDGVIVSADIKSVIGGGTVGDGVVVGNEFLHVRSLLSTCLIVISMRINRSSIAEGRNGIAHVLSDLDTEGATCLAHPALHALARVMLECRIVFSNCLRHRRLRLRQIQKLGDVCDIDLLRAWCAMAAVHAMSRPIDLGEGRKRRCKILLLIACLLVSNRLFQLLNRMRAREYDGDGRSAQRIMNALIDGQSGARG